MFKSIQFSAFRSAKSYNVFHLQDTCFSDYIHSPYNSPSLKSIPNAISSGLTLLTIVRHYESKNRNVALNLAYYYYWLNEGVGYYIDKAFIRKQLSTIDHVMPHMNFMKKYFHSVCYYLSSRHLLYID